MGTVVYIRFWLRRNRLFWRLTA